jgi:NADP-dependent 3-hydroxy acid dehydrogenase YdfG
MKVKELMQALANLPPELDVFVWNAGDRLNIEYVDDSFIHDEYAFVDLNTDTDSKVETK